MGRSGDGARPKGAGGPWRRWTIGPGRGCVRRGTPDAPSAKLGARRARSWPGGGATVTNLPSTMPAAVYREPGRVELEERAVPALGPGQVMVEVGHCGICGSDIPLMLEGWGQKGTVEGHEWSGVVVA